MRMKQWVQWSVISIQEILPGLEQAHNNCLWNSNRIYIRLQILKYSKCKVVLEAILKVCEYF